MESELLENKPLPQKKSLFKSNKLKKQNRIWELDFIRGICVILMIWDHFMYNVNDIFGEAWAIANPANNAIYELSISYFDGMLRNIFHPIIFGLFFLLCGISCNLSKSNLKRGVQALFLAFGITVVTSALNVPITFGVLHMLAFSILIYSIIDGICLHNKKLISLVCLIAAMVIIVVTQVYTEYPPENANSDLVFIAEYLGNPSTYGSADFFAVIPNIAYVLLGASVGHFLYGERKSVLPFLDKYGWHKPISFLGSKALWVYVLHQPIIVTLMSLISYLFITPGDFIFFWPIL